MSNSDMEKFIVDLGFSDKDAITGLKSFLKKVDNLSVQVNAKVRATTQKAQSATSKANKSAMAGIKKENSLLSAQNSLRAKIAAAEKVGIDTSSEKRSLQRAKGIETLTKRRLELEKQILKAKEAQSRLKPKTKEPPTKPKANELAAEDKLKQASLRRTAKLEAQMRDAANEDLARDFKRKIQQEQAIEKERLKTLNKLKAAEQQASSQKLRREQKLSEQLRKQDRARIDLKTKLEKEHLARVRRFENSKNFRTLSQQKPEQARELSGAFTQRSSILRRQSLGGVDPRGIDKTVRGMNDLKNSVDNASSAIRRQARVAMGLTTAQNGLRDSTRNMIRTYASIFAVFEGTRAINKTGQAFEALNSAMLAAMGTKEEAAKQISFLNDLTDTLGMSLLDTADQYTKFTFASKGKLETEQVNELFQSMAEMGTVLGVSKERMKLSFTAIQQIKIFKVCLVSNC